MKSDTHTHIYIAPKIVRKNLRHWHRMTLAYRVRADWKRWNFRWRLKVDRVSIERMCAGRPREFQVEGADTENAREEKLLVMPAGLVRRFVLEERKHLNGR